MHFYRRPRHYSWAVSGKLAVLLWICTKDYAYELRNPERFNSRGILNLFPRDTDIRSRFWDPIRSDVLNVRGRGEWLQCEPTTEQGLQSERKGITIKIPSLFARARFLSFFPLRKSKLSYIPKHNPNRILPQTKILYPHFQKAKCAGTYATTAPFVVSTNEAWIVSNHVVMDQGRDIDTSSDKRIFPDRVMTLKDAAEDFCRYKK